MIQPKIRDVWPTGERCGGTYRAYRVSFWATDDPDASEDFQQHIREIQAWAQRHAETCRAMPRPGAGGGQ